MINEYTVGMQLLILSKSLWAKSFDGLACNLCSPCASEATNLSWLTSGPSHKGELLWEGGLLNCGREATNCPGCRLRSAGTEDEYQNQSDRSKARFLLDVRPVRARRLCLLKKFTARYWAG